MRLATHAVHVARLGPRVTSDTPASTPVAVASTRTISIHLPMIGRHDPMGGSRWTRDGERGTLNVGDRWSSA